MSSTPNDRFLLRRKIPSIINMREVISRTDFMLTYSRSQSNFTQTTDAVCRYNPFEENAFIQTDRFMSLTATEWPDDEPSDRKLLQEIIYYFQGVNGKFVSFDPITGYRINSTPLLNDRIHLVAYILEHGWLSIQIGEMLENQLPGLIKDRLTSAIREILVQFHKEINVFPMGQQFEDCSNEFALACKGDTNERPIGMTNLKEALCWARGSMLALTSIISLLNTSRELQGCSMLNPIVEWLNHGNSHLFPSMTYIFNGAVCPMLKMIKTWLCKGELDDPYQEFFIAPNSGTIHSFNDQFVVRNELKPKWISNNLSNYILKCGTLVYMYNTYTDGESDEVTETANEIFSIISDCIGRGPSGLDELKNKHLPCKFKELYDKLANIIFVSVSESTNLKEEFKFRHRYVLLGKGDFINVLVKKMMNEVYGNLQAQKGETVSLLSAVHDWAMPSELDIVRESLQIDITFENEQRDPLADYFALSFKTKGLAELILKPFSEVYQKIFTFLWKIQIAEYILKVFRRDVIWPLKKLHNESIRNMQKDLIEVCHILYMFVICLQNYMTGIVVDKHWNAFLNKYIHVQTLDELVDAHRECLKAILIETLQDKNSKDVLVNITVILDLVSELRSIGEHFSKVIEEVRHGLKIKSFGVMLLRAKIKIILQMFKESISLIINEKNHKKFRLFQEYMNFNDYYWKKNSDFLPIIKI